VINKRKQAISMVELLIATTLAMIIATAVFALHRIGARASIYSVVNLDAMAEGRKILLQIRDDLKNSCIPYRGAFAISFKDLLQIDFSKNRGLEGAEFSLLRFRYEPEFAKTALPGPEYLLRPLLNVRYRLEKADSSGLLKLIRETAPGTSQTKSRVLSDRISFFNITPVRINSSNDHENWLWNVHLHIGKTSDRTVVNAGTRSMNVFEFYDVVSSDFYTAISNHRNSPRNWHTGLRYSPE